VVGVELVPEYAREAESRLDRVLVGDAMAALPKAAADAPFDCLVAADVLEHTLDPWTLLGEAVALLAPGATVVISLPNVLNAQALLRLVRERRWPRDDEGIFDRTHLRWFAPSDMRALLEGAGLVVERVEPRYFVTGRALALRKRLARTPLDPFLAPQYVISARKPGEV
jgi:SAM-dependent methyltransferase